MIRLALLLLVPALSAQAVTPLQWSIRMADSEMARRGDSLAWKEGGRAKWDYTTGLFAHSLIELHKRVNDPRYLRFTESIIGSFITTNGEIRTYKFEDYSLDNVNPGRAALELYVITKDERYKKATDVLRKQLAEQPRTASGGFWHKQKYPNQMWLDGLYMEAPFYTMFGKLFHEPLAFDEVAKQILLIDVHTYDPKSGLFYHGWDESRAQGWANKQTGTSANFWGRAIGWYSMALVDTLDFLPTQHPKRKAILEVLRRLAYGVIRHQDKKTGLWYQVVDQGGRAGNYLEASSSSMYVYSLAKAVNRGYLPRSKYVPAIRRGYDGIVRDFVKVDADGKVNLTQCCEVAGLGGDRDGSYEYYLRERIVSNDLKCVGPFILAGIEVDRL